MLTVESTLCYELTQYQIFWHMFNFFRQLWCFDFLRVYQIKMTSENLKYNILPIFFFVLCTTSGCSTVKAVSIIQGGTPHLESSNREDVNVNISEMAHFLIVKAQINNSSNLYNFIIDTGSLTVIDEKVAEKLDLKEEVMIQLDDSSGHRKNVPLVKIAQIRVGNLEVGNCAAAIAGLKKIDPGIDGIIGSNFLKHFTVQIDYRNSTLEPV